MRYEVEFLPVALRQLRALPREARRLIGVKIDHLQDDLTGDVKKLQGFKHKYRLRATVEDIEDARIIERAKKAHGKQPRVPWSQVKKELSLP